MWSQKTVSIVVIVIVIPVDFRDSGTVLDKAAVSHHGTVADQLTEHVLCS